MFGCIRLEKCQKNECLIISKTHEITVLVRLRAAWKYVQKTTTLQIFGSMGLNIVKGSEILSCSHNFTSVSYINQSCQEEEKVEKD